jgi:capsular polysaccharide biosynthesis protein
MELRRYLRLVRQRLILVLVAVLAGAGVGYVITSRTPAYTATAEIYVGPTNFGINDNLLYEEGNLNEVVTTYSFMIPSPVIAQKAIDAAHIDRNAGEVAASTTTLVVTGTQLIDVSVTDPSQSIAIQLANSVSHAFINSISNSQAAASSGTGTSGGTGTVPNAPAHVFQDATFATSSSSGLTKRMILGVAFGFILSIFIIFLLDYLDITIKSPDELERRVGLPVLGIIPRFNTLRLDSSPVGSLQRPVSRGAGG